METFLLYKHFQQSPALPSARQELADFWLGFLLTSCQPFVPEPCCPVGSSPGDPGTDGGTRGDHVWWLQVLVLEHGKVLQPARLALRSAAEEPAVMLSLVCPTEEVGPGLGSWGCPLAVSHPALLLLPAESSVELEVPTRSHPGRQVRVSPIPPALGAAPQPHCLWGGGGGLFSSQHLQERRAGLLSLRGSH